MAAEIIPIDPQDFSTQVYEGTDTNLISTFEVTTNLSSSSYIEYFIYDNNQTLLSTEYNFSQYTIQNSLPGYFKWIDLKRYSTSLATMKFGKMPKLAQSFCKCCSLAGLKK